MPSHCPRVFRDARPPLGTQTARISAFEGARVPAYVIGYIPAVIFFLMIIDGAVGKR